MGEARETVDRFYRSAGDGDLEPLSACFADECMTTTPAGTFDKVQHEAFFAAFKRAMPDAHMQVVRAVESGDEVFVSGRFKGTHHCDLVTPQGTIPAPGQLARHALRRLLPSRRWKDRRTRVVWDSMTMMAQLGSAPPQ